MAVITCFDLLQEIITFALLVLLTSVAGIAAVLLRNFGQRFFL